MVSEASLWHYVFLYLEGALTLLSQRLLHNNLDPTTYQKRHYVGKNGFPRGDFEISRWRIFIFHVGKKKFFGGIK